MPSAVSRRVFLTTAAAVAGSAFAGARAPQVRRVCSFAAPSPGPDCVLVLAHLMGGNDGINTIIPFRDDAYYALRPSLALPARRLLPLNDVLALNDRLAPLAALYENGRIAIVLGVGHPEQDRSHFGACKAWHTAGDLASPFESGWLGRHFGPETERLCRALGPQGAAVFKPPSGSEHAGRATRVHSAPSPVLPARRGVDGFRRVAGTLESDNPLRAVAHDIARGAHTRAYYVALPGFDTHANQAEAHDALLHEFALAVAGFQARLRASGDSGRVLLMAYSEFGRRAAENASRGADHGTSGPVFLIGDAVRPGIYGHVPPLIAGEGNISTDVHVSTDEHVRDYSVDYREIYAAIVQDWFGRNPTHVLGRSFAPLPALA